MTYARAAMLTTRQKIALAQAVQSPLVVARKLAGRGVVTQVRRRGVAWSLDLREGIDFSIWLLGAFELSTVRAYERIIARGGVVLDIGANIGAHTLHLARAVGPDGKVWAIEPTEYALGKLKANIALNPGLAERIACRQVMLVDRDGIEVPPLHSSWPLTGGSDLHERHGGRLMATENARALTLDSFVRECGIKRVDFVKLDIDGHECGMLRGAQETLRIFHPTVLLELSPHQLEEHGGSIEQLVDLLAGVGYALQDIVSRAPLPMSGYALRALIPWGASLNVMAVAASTRRDR